MDSITHTLVGVGVGAVATKFLNLNGTEELIIISASILASNIQDCDVISKFFGNISFINNHRGESHMIKWVPVFALLISTLFLYLFKIEIGNIFLVSVISLLLHIGLDSLNSYGTKLLSNNWIRLGVIHTYDLFLLLVLASSTIFLFFFDINIFTYTFILICIYLAVRFLTQSLIKKRLRNKYKPIRELILAKGNSLTWNIVLEFNDYYLVFDYMLRKELKKDYIKKEFVDNEIIKSVEDTKVISAFKGISPIYIIKAVVNESGILIKFTDLRYRYNGKYYFNAVYKLNNKQNSSYSIGWNLKHAESL